MLTYVQIHKFWETNNFKNPKTRTVEFSVLSGETAHIYSVTYHHTVVKLCSLIYLECMQSELHRPFGRRVFKLCIIVTLISRLIMLNHLEDTLFLLKFLPCLKLLTVLPLEVFHSDLCAV